MCEEGYQVLFDGTMHTVWSAPDYCYRYKNMASIAEIDENLNDFFNVFSASPENAENRKKAPEFNFLEGIEEGGNPYFI